MKKQTIFLYLVFALLSLSTATTTAAGNSDVNIVTQRPHVPPELQAAYAHLQHKNLNAARESYARFLLQEPNNTDALLGMAAIAEHLGQHDEATRHQEKALNSAPLDAATNAAWLNHHNHPPAQNESRLKTLLQQQSQAAPLYFAMGNLLARQRRWHEAQDAYFGAVANDGNNPDYLFNLAVSLDHLQQHALARQHYAQALKAASMRPAAFEARLLEQRLQVLSP